MQIFVCIKCILPDLVCLGISFSYISLNYGVSFLVLGFARFYFSKRDLRDFENIFFFFKFVENLFEILYQVKLRMTAKTNEVYRMPVRLESSTKLLVKKVQTRFWNLYLPKTHTRVLCCSRIARGNIIHY